MKVVLLLLLPICLGAPREARQFGWLKNLFQNDKSVELAQPRAIQHRALPPVQLQYKRRQAPQRTRPVQRQELSKRRLLMPVIISSYSSTNIQGGKGEDDIPVIQPVANTDKDGIEESVAEPLSNDIPEIAAEEVEDLSVDELIEEIEIFKERPTPVTSDVVSEDAALLDGAPYQENSLLDASSYLPDGSPYLPDLPASLDRQNQVYPDLNERYQLVVKDTRVNLNQDNFAVSTEKKSVSTEQKVDNTITEDSANAITEENAVITEDAAATKPLQEEKNKVVVPKKKFPQRIDVAAFNAPPKKSRPDFVPAKPESSSFFDFIPGFLSRNLPKPTRQPPVRPTGNSPPSRNRQPLNGQPPLRTPVIGQRPLGQPPQRPTLIGQPPQRPSVVGQPQKFERPPPPANVNADDDLNADTARIDDAATELVEPKPFIVTGEVKPNARAPVQPPRPQLPPPRLRRPQPPRGYPQGYPPKPKLNLQKIPPNRKQAPFLPPPPPRRTLNPNHSNHQRHNQVQQNNQVGPAPHLAGPQHHPAGPQHQVGGPPQRPVEGGQLPVQRKPYPPGSRRKEGNKPSLPFFKDDGAPTSPSPPVSSTPSPPPRPPPSSDSYGKGTDFAAHLSSLLTSFFSTTTTPPQELSLNNLVEDTEFGQVVKGYASTTRPLTRAPTTPTVYSSSSLPPSSSSAAEILDEELDSLSAPLPKPIVKPNSPLGKPIRPKQKPLPRKPLPVPKPFKQVSNLQKPKLSVQNKPNPAVINIEVQKTQETTLLPSTTSSTTTTTTTTTLPTTTTAPPTRAPFVPVTSTLSAPFQEVVDGYRNNFKTVPQDKLSSTVLKTLQKNFEQKKNIFQQFVNIDAQDTPFLPNAEVFSSSPWSRGQPLAIKNINAPDLGLARSGQPRTSTVDPTTEQSSLPPPATPSADVEVFPSERNAESGFRPMVRPLHSPLS